MSSPFFTQAASVASRALSLCGFVAWTSIIGASAFVPIAPQSPAFLEMAFFAVRTSSFMLIAALVPLASSHSRFRRAVFFILALHLGVYCAYVLGNGRSPAPVFLCATSLLAVAGVGNVVLRLVFRPYAACRSRLWRGFRLD